MRSPDSPQHNGYFIIGAVAMGMLEDKIAAAEAKVKQLKAELQKVEARKKAAEVKRKRQDDTRRKVLAGAVLLARVEAGEWSQTEFTAMMDKGLTRNEDRALFELPAIAETTAAEKAPEPKAA
jgi:hypothetical protein